MSQTTGHRYHLTQRLNRHLAHTCTEWYIQNGTRFYASATVRRHVNFALSALSIVFMLSLGLQAE